MAAYNYRLLLKYDGTDYSGWQIQSAHRSIQGTVTAAIEKVARQPIVLIGSGRTDAGVHAHGQVANFKCDLKLDPATWMRALNALLPPDIRVFSVASAPTAFHARKDAIAKRYRYNIYTGRILKPWESRYCLHWPRAMDLDPMQKAAECLLGSHDMHSFAASGTTVKSFHRCVYLSQWKARNDWLTYIIEADGFLQHMVRSIVGTLLEVGSGRLTAAGFAEILKARDRRSAGRTAPPQGLFLDRVYYRRRRNK